MVPLLMWAGVFVISLLVLVKASDYFTLSAEKIGLFFGMAPFIVGVTIVSIGTSLPELISSIFAVVQKSSEIVIGNVIGSNITNIFLILGLATLISRKTIKIDFGLIHVDLPLLICSAFLLGLTILDGKFTLMDALLCLASYLAYLLYTITAEKTHEDIEIEKEMKKMKKIRKMGWKTPLILVFSSALIFLGAKYTVVSVIEISKILNVGKEIIALSAVALGTSLPELAVTCTAARKGKPEIAVGNILGSNIFNSLVVMGIPGLISNINIPRSIITFSLPLMVIATLIYYFITEDKEITKWEGYMLLVFYIFFIAKLFHIA
ncbi:calcium/sodium antiporter [Candidatus Woesearchaeota archaeon]|nr:calcium/sodium antiporter [Candidatus Woesearchaeota archaeon]